MDITPSSAIACKRFEHDRRLKTAAGSKANIPGARRHDLKNTTTSGNTANWGIWSTENGKTTSTKEVKQDGQFVRKPSAFRNWVTVDGSPGPTGTGGFKAEVGRYHLYVSYACPWAHRALIYRNILGLEDVIDISVVHPVNMENGWEFADFPGATPDAINNARYMYQVYTPLRTGLFGQGHGSGPVGPRDWQNCQQRVRRQSFERSLTVSNHSHQHGRISCLPRNATRSMR